MRGHRHIYLEHAYTNIHTIVLNWRMCPYIHTGIQAQLSQPDDKHMHQRAGNERVAEPVWLGCPGRLAQSFVYPPFLLGALRKARPKPAGPGSGRAQPGPGQRPAKARPPGQGPAWARSMPLYCVTPALPNAFPKALPRPAKKPWRGRGKQPILFKNP